MIRFINKTILVDLAHKAVLNYVEQGKEVPQTMEGMEELLLTVLTKKELDLYGKLPWADSATHEVIEWLLSEDQLRAWFGQCELGRMLVEARAEAKTG